MLSLNPLDGIMQTWLNWVIPVCKDIVVLMGIAFYILTRVTLHQSHRSDDLPGVLEFRRSFASSSFDHLLLLTAGLELFLLVLPLFIEYKRFFYQSRLLSYFPVIVWVGYAIRLVTGTDAAFWLRNMSVCLWHWYLLAAVCVIYFLFISIKDPAEFDDRRMRGNRLFDERRRQNRALAGCWIVAVTIMTLFVFIRGGASSHVGNFHTLPIALRIFYLSFWGFILLVISPFVLNWVKLVLIRHHDLKWNRLRQAVENGNLKDLQGQIQAGANPFHSSDYQPTNTPTRSSLAIVAAAHNQNHVLLYLLNDVKGVSIWETEYGTGHTALMKAIINKNQEAAQLILQKLNGWAAKLIKEFLVETKDDNGDCALMVACRYGCNVMIELLLPHYAGINLSLLQNKGRFSPITLAIQQGHPNTVEYLVEDVNESFASLKDGYGRTPLMVAAIYGQLGILKYLVEARQVEDLGFQTDGYPEDAWQKGRKGDKAIHFAAANGHLDIVKYLIETRKVPVDEPDEEGFTPLYRAIDGGQLHVVEYLVEKGADINKRVQESTDHFWTPQYWAAYNLLSRYPSQDEATRPHRERRKRIIEYLLSLPNVDTNVIVKDMTNTDSFMGKLLTENKDIYDLLSSDIEKRRVMMTTRSIVQRRGTRAQATVPDNTKAQATVSEKTDQPPPTEEQTRQAVAKWVMTGANTDMFRQLMDFFPGNSTTDFPSRRPAVSRGQKKQLAVRAKQLLPDAA